MSVVGVQVVQGRAWGERVAKTKRAEHKKSEGWPSCGGMIFMIPRDEERGT
jgi:hypothetical protein